MKYAIKEYNGRWFNSKDIIQESRRYSKISFLIENAGKGAKKGPEKDEEDLEKYEEDLKIRQNNRIEGFPEKT